MVVNELEKVPKRPSDETEARKESTPQHPEAKTEKGSAEPKFEKVEIRELPESIFRLEFARVKLALALDFIKKGKVVSFISRGKLRIQVENIK